MVSSPGSDLRSGRRFAPHRRRWPRFSAWSSRYGQGTWRLQGTAAREPPLPQGDRFSKHTAAKKMPFSQDTLPEWSKGVDSSSTSASCVGSNPTGVMGSLQRPLCLQARAAALRPAGLAGTVGNGVRPEWAHRRQQSWPHQPQLAGNRTCADSAHLPELRGLRSHVCHWISQRPLAGSCAALRTLCPSGLRWWTQVPLARAAWAQIPQVSSLQRPCGQQCRTVAKVAEGFCRRRRPVCHQTSSAPFQVASLAACQQQFRGHGLADRQGHFARVV